MENDTDRPAVNVVVAGAKDSAAACTTYFVCGITVGFCSRGGPEPVNIPVDTFIARWSGNQYV